MTLEDEQVASLPKMEKFLFTISTGITGLEILKEYGAKSTELEYFINFCREKQDLSVSAMGPSSLTQRYSERIKGSYNRVIDEMQDFFSKDYSKEKVETILLELSDLHDLLSKIYDVAKSTSIRF
jgi:hypothetical protein